MDKSNDITNCSNTNCHPKEFNLYFDLENPKNDELENFCDESLQ